jgi:hypothetical protein
MEKKPLGRKGSPIIREDDLERVARVARAAGKSRIQAVREEWGVSRATAWRAIDAARKAGHDVGGGEAQPTGITAPARTAEYYKQYARIRGRALTRLGQNHRAELQEQLLADPRPHAARKYLAHKYPQELRRLIDEERRKGSELRYHPTGIQVSQAIDPAAYQREYNRVMKNKGIVRERALRRLGQMYPQLLQRLIDEEQNR